MFRAKNGLGDIIVREVADVAAFLDRLAINEEVSFTQDIFESEQLYETVLSGLNVAGYKCVLNCGVHRWFLNEDNCRNFTADFRKDIIILRRGKDYEKA